MAKATKKDDEVTPKTSREEMGYTGLVQYGGYIEEEFVPELKGDRRHKTYAEMRDNDATIGAMLFAADKLLRAVAWPLNAAEEDRDHEVSDFVASCVDDMEHTWTDFISQAVSFIVHGYSLFEPVFKLRKGDDQVYSDGRLGWRKFGYRSPTTIPRWEFDDKTGECIAAIQCGPPTYKEVRLPLARCLLFRTTADKENPEGRSAIRNCYFPWYFKKNLQKFEGIGIERDLAGLPCVYAPPQIFSATATDKEKAMKAELESIVQRVRNDRQSGLVLPSIYDAAGHKLLEFTLLSTAGTRKIDLTPAINRYSAEIAQTMLADFVLLGHEQTGSFALADSKTAMFATGLGSFLDNIQNVLNRVAIPTLLRLNGIDRRLAPKFAHGDIDEQDLAAIGTYVSQLVSCGAIMPDGALETDLRRKAGLPDAGTE